MTVGFKDSPEIVEFRRLFARLREWSEDDPAGLRELARTDEGIQELGLSILRAAGRIQRSEQAGRDLFTGPVDAIFISEWRDFEERFTQALLDIRSDMAAAHKSDLLFSLDYYEEPDHWYVADFKAIYAARSLDATIMFATTQAEHAGKDGDGLTWREINVKAFSDETRRAFMELVKAASEAEDSYEAFRDHLRSGIVSSSGARKPSEDLALLRRMEDERSREDGMLIENVAKDAFAFWETLKVRSGLDLRGVLRRRALIPFTLFPRHVSARLNNTDLPSIYRNLRQAHDAFVFGVSFAALALMRSVMEMIVRDHYGATGANLKELINSVASRLPRRANAGALHRLRKLANEVLHGDHDKIAHSRAEERNFEREIVSLFFVLRALVEGAPQLRKR